MGGGLGQAQQTLGGGPAASSSATVMHIPFYFGYASSSKEYVVYIWDLFAVNWT